MGQKHAYVQDPAIPRMNYGLLPGPRVGAPADNTPGLVTRIVPHDPIGNASPTTYAILTPGAQATITMPDIYDQLWIKLTTFVTPPTLGDVAKRVYYRLALNSKFKSDWISFSQELQYEANPGSTVYADSGPMMRVISRFNQILLYNGAPLGTVGIDGYAAKAPSALWSP